MATNLRRTVGIALTAAGTALALLFGPASPASAAYDKKTCAINGYIKVQYYCTTPIIGAHESQHWVRVTWDAYPGCSGTWKLYDKVTGVRVGAGEGAHIDTYVYGLYGTFRYYARFDRIGGVGCGGDGSVWNYN